MKASLKNYHQSPRKVRLVADFIRGKKVEDARAALLFMPQKSSPVMTKLLNSAVANAREAGIDTENLFVKTIAVNKGAVMKRLRPFSRGRGGTIRKTMSIVTLELGTSPSPRKSRAKKVAKKTVKEITIETK